jgi:RNA-directed DNA polymerase
MFGKIAALFGMKDKGLGVDELSRRLKMSAAELQAIPIAYEEFSIPKRSGGVRKILAPNLKLKAVQRRLLHQLFRKLKAFPLATGFERNHSIVTNAACHVGKAVIVKMDVKDFFPTTSTERVQQYFRKIGWNREATELLTKLCTHQGGLPQGAPTSPRLSNLVNYRLDVRLSKAAAALGASYTRYADDLTFSFAEDRPAAVRKLIHICQIVVREEGYSLHLRKKLHIRRCHQRQIVTGLVVNEKVSLSREKRRWLRAVEHHLKTGRPATLSLAQLSGWKALQSMIAVQGALARRFSQPS